MKYKGFGKGQIVEGFALLPHIDVNWMDVYSGNNKYEKHWEIQFAWFFWYCSFGFIN